MDVGAGLMRRRRIELEPGEYDAVLFGMECILSEGGDEEAGAELLVGADSLVCDLRAAGIRIAVLSDSSNAAEALEQAGLEGLFDVRVDGIVASEEGLGGRPAPDLALEAAQRLEVAPEWCVLVDGTPAGVEAGRRGGFGRVIGVSRGDDRETLAEAGADDVVAALSEIGVDAETGRERPIGSLDSALAGIDRIVAWIGDREPVFFLDFDGTLAPIVDHPEQAEIPEETHALLEALSRRRTVAIVSGRDLDDLRGRIALDRVYYAGSHGFRLAGPGGLDREYPEARRFLSALDEAEQTLEEVLADLPGVEVERKRYAIALHHRRASESAAAEVRRAAARVQEGCKALRIGEGRKVLELRPAIDWDKGRAVEWLLETLGLGGGRSFPIYVGDDITDEDAFAVVEEEGYPVVVRGRSGCTRARASLSDPVEVGLFLSRIDEGLRRG